MAELKIGTKFEGRVEVDAGVFQIVEAEVTDLLPGGNVELTWGEGNKQIVPATWVMPPQGGYSMSATAPVMGLQPDPPAHIARMAEKGIVILPSPVAPPTNPPVPHGKTMFAGKDGFLHEVPEASTD